MRSYKEDSRKHDKLDNNGRLYRLHYNARIESVVGVFLQVCKRYNKVSLFIQCFQ